MQIVPKFGALVTRFFLLAIPLLAAIPPISGCIEGGTDTPDSPDCKDPKGVCGLQTIHADPNDFFTLTTPEARNDCEATYYFGFRWADPGRQLVDTTAPPIEDLAHAFQPADEFSYFPHPTPLYDNSVVFSDCSDQPLPGHGWWYINFSIGNRTSGLPATRYYVRARLDPSFSGPLDDTEIVCHIYYKEK